MIILGCKSYKQHFNWIRRLTGKQRRNSNSMLWVTSATIHLGLRLPNLSWQLVGNWRNLFGERERPGPGHWYYVVCDRGYGWGQTCPNPRQSLKRCIPGEPGRKGQISTKTTRERLLAVVGGVTLPLAHSILCRRWGSNLWGSEEDRESWYLIYMPYICWRHHQLRFHSNLVLALSSLGSHR